MRRTKNLKLPNGFGSIEYLGKNRRKPFVVRKTTGWDSETGKQIKITIGTAETWLKAYDILKIYNGNPYDLDFKDISLGTIFLDVKSELEVQLSKRKTSESNYKALMSAWNQHLSEFSNTKILNIKRSDIQKLIDNSGLSYTSRNYIKILFSKIIDTANHEYQLKIDSSIFHLDLGDKEKSNLHVPFSINEIKKIYECVEFNDIAKMIMIYLYTGLRPSELLDIEIENIHINEKYMIGGIKTESGINRIIPINHKIMRFIEYFYNEDNEYLIINKETGKKMTYDMYRNRFEVFMKTLHMNHKPHDTRHSFATICDGIIDDITIKILMGHSLGGDVTHEVYIHKTVEKLLKEIEKIDYGEELSV